MAAVAKSKVSPSSPASSSPRSQAFSPRTKNQVMVARVSNDDTGKLPQLKTSDNMVDKTKPLPTSLQSDFLPTNVLIALTQPPPPTEKPRLPSRYRNLHTSTGPAKKAPASVWGFPNRREKFKHLTDSTPCICGAGNDISFLYDVPKKDEKVIKIDPEDKSGVRKAEAGQDDSREGLKLPDTLIPEEYHIVKNKGVMGLEYHEDTFGTQPKDHESHLVLFPSMNPTSRFEVVQLQKTLEDLLEKAGLNDDDLELKGPTQMHNLLELIKKEQNIYNIIFHELIRQVSVECIERGQLLAEVRSRYNGLLNRVPKQIKGLHEEVLAQRALDRRLTEEMLRFKSTISFLTRELTEVKQHDVEVTESALQAQEDLKAALAESEKNTSLLAEYHELYELQRKRLEAQVLQLTNEKEIWSTAAYNLALKVMEEHSLNTAKRLHISEKAWAKLAKHFTIRLSDADTEMLTSLQTYVDKWHEMIDEFNRQLLQREELTRQQFHAVSAGIKHCIGSFEKHVLGPEGELMQVPDKDRVSAFYGDLKTWGEILSAEGEKFTGDVLLSAQEALHKISSQMDGWRDCSIQLFARHRTEAGENHPDFEDMLQVNKQVETLLGQYHVRLLGENGVATGLIHLGNYIETWENKLNAVIHGANPLPDNEWLRYYQIMDDWLLTLQQTLECVGLTQTESDRISNKEHHKIEVTDVVKMTQKWLSSAINGMDSEDAKLVESVSSLHSDMVQWMVQMLLRLAPDHAEHTKEARESILVASSSIGQLQSSAKSLTERLDGFSKYVTLCCSGLVMEEMQRRLDAREENADHEYRDLLQLQSECDDWVRTAQIMLCELTGEPLHDIPVVSKSSRRIDVVPPKPTQSMESAETRGEERGAKEQDTDTAAWSQEMIKDQEQREQTEDPLEQGPVMEQGEQTEDPEEQEVAEQPTEANLKDAGSKYSQGEQVEEEEKESNSEELEVIGQDASTRKTSLRRSPDAEPVNTREGTKPAEGAPNTKAAYAALGTVDTLQEQLLATEKRAQESEEQLAMAEAELVAAQERIRALERELTKTPSGGSAKSKPESPIVSISEVTVQSVKPSAATPQAEKEKPKSPKLHTSLSRGSSKSSTKLKKGK